MELALNIAWAVISAALLWLTCVSSSRRQGSRTAAVIAFAALVCLLFPVISMTDDLSAAPALLQSKQTRELPGSGEMHALLVFLITDAYNLELVRQMANPLTRLSAPASESFSFSLNRRPPPLLPEPTWIS